MIIRYSRNIFAQIAAIIWYNKFKLLWFISCACVAYFSYHHLGFSKIGVPMIPISILGGALAIFLGFRNSSAYDRWWEGRKIWGQMVNDSRTFVMQLNSYLSKRDETINDETIDSVLYSIVRRHIAWVYVLKFQLLNQNTEELLKEWIDKDELNFYNNKENIATQLLNKQGLEIKKLQECNIIEDFRQFELINTISSFYDSQGKVERIKSTVFPFYYNYYTRLVLSLFNLLLPFGLVNHLDWTLIPMLSLIHI